MEKLVSQSELWDAMLSEMLKQDDKKVAHAWLEAANIVASANVLEHIETTAKWLKVDNRPKGQKFRCSSCAGIVYGMPNKGKCEYRWCPCCKSAMEVDA